MSETTLAIVFAIFIWWFSTGIVLLLNHMSRSAVSVSLFLSSLLGVAALVGLMHTARQTDIAGAYCAFTCALLAWGWNELSFLTGWITGPRTTALRKDVQGWPRFVESFRAVMWHEFGILFVGVVIITITWDAPNQVGTGTYLVLWIMRTSAKLNLFFGVRNLSEEFLPPHLAYLQSFFRRRAMNWFFPLSVAAASAYLAVLVSNAKGADLAAVALGHTLVGTLLALAIVEHLLLVLPVDTTALWRWAISKRGNPSEKNLPGASAQTAKVHISAAYSAAPAPGQGADILDAHDKFFQVR
jgi:putative photosynthetic complex assembly protein 2